MKKIMPVDKENLLIRLKDLVSHLEKSFFLSKDLVNDIFELYEYDASEYLRVFSELTNSLEKTLSNFVVHKTKVENDEVIE